LARLCAVSENSNGDLALFPRGQILIAIFPEEITNCDVFDIHLE
jgi:hypothetical protein